MDEAHLPVGSDKGRRGLGLMRGAMRHGATAMGAIVLEAAGLEKGDNRRFAVRAHHGLIVPQGIETAFAGGTALLHGPLDPYGLAFLAGDRTGGIGSGGGLAGGHEAGEREDASKE